MRPHRAGDAAADRAERVVQFDAFR